jgi:hypothetical protein
MRCISGFLIIAGGALVSGWAIKGAIALHHLLQDEGTESFAARIGFGGLVGCIAFLTIVGAVGLLLPAMECA